MPLPLRVVLATLLVTLGLAAAPPAHAAATPRWGPPVPGEVVAGFRFDRRAPFAAGARRGVDLATRPGEVVRAACRGRVTFAGRTPWGRGVTVRCGGLVATHLRLGRLTARRGVVVARGSRLGRAAGAAVRLGARRAGDPFGYVDPLALLGGTDGPPPPLPAVAPRPRPRPAPPSVAPRVAPPPVAPRVPSPATRPAAHPGTTPSLAWLALGLAALGLPTGALAHGRRRARRPRPRTAPPVRLADRRIP